MSVCLTRDRFTAAYHHLFTCNGHSLEFDQAAPALELTFLPDTGAGQQPYQQSGWAVSGPWGPVGYGTRWPDRWMVRDRST